MLNAQNYYLLSATALAYSIISCAYINPAIYTICLAYLLAINTAIFFLLYFLFFSSFLALNAVDLRKNRQLMLIAISRYAAIINSYSILIQLLRFNAFYNLLVVYLRLFALASYIYNNTAFFFYTNASNYCQNSNTNYKYYITNLPTLRSKYQQIILTLLLTLYLLQYCVTNITILSLINILQYPPLTVLL